MIHHEVTEELKTRFRRARRVGVLTGAGVSAESGVPTFRGGGDSATWKGWPLEQLSSAEMLLANPSLVWDWFNHRREAVSQVRPNPAHYALARWPARFDGFMLVTQNIDDLHRLAGSEKLLELHGNMWRVCCLECGRVAENRELPMGVNPAICSCGGILRPDVVLFGEPLPEGILERAIDGASRCDVFFVVGTSLLVFPAARLPLVAKRAGAYVIEINREETPVTSVADATVLGKAGEVLPAFTA